LLDRNHLALQQRKFGRRLLVAADKEGRRPEDDDSRRGGQAVIGSLLVLRTRQRCRPRRYGLSLQRQLLAGV
jgi:hypothetical protein